MIPDRRRCLPSGAQVSLQELKKSTTFSERTQGVCGLVETTPDRGHPLPHAAMHNTHAVVVRTQNGQRYTHEQRVDDGRPE